MKNWILVAFIFAMASCGVSKEVSPTADANAIKPEKNEEGEWDLDVLDPQYNYFLNAVARPMNAYTESGLKIRNQTLVNEWNSYFYSGRYPNIIGSSIDYNANENYGLKFEYKLYQVFAYVRWQYGLRLAGLSGVDTHGR
ncbi:MAG: DUF6146 family protein [Capnocytophaga sp.]|nr:DUF6146 family protein [Capnocytophaga sp.]